MSCRVVRPLAYAAHPVVLRSGVVALLLDAMEDEEIAPALGVSVHTVRECVAYLTELYGARNRVALALMLAAEEWD